MLPFFFQDHGVDVVAVDALLTARMLSRERTFRILRSVGRPKLERRGDVPHASRRRRARGSYHGWAVSERGGSVGSPRQEHEHGTAQRDATTRRYAIRGAHFPSTLCPGVRVRNVNVRPHAVHSSSTLGTVCALATRRPRTTTATEPSARVSGDALSTPLPLPRARGERGRKR